MKKRLRKKFKLGEYTEFEFQVDFKMKDAPEGEGVDALLGEFLDAIEARGLVGGGTFSNQGDFTFSLYANRARVAVTQEHREVVAAWLSARTDLASHTVGPLVDAWHPVG